jgi:hypothetical protein
VVALQGDEKLLMVPILVGRCREDILAVGSPLNLLVLTGSQLAAVDAAVDAAVHSHGMCARCYQD